MNQSFLTPNSFTLQSDRASDRNRNVTINSNIWDSTLLATNNSMGNEQSSSVRECDYSEISFTEKGLYVMYTNADSLFNKREELLALLEMCHYDIIVITETLPKNREHMNIQTQELEISGYNMYTIDTNNYVGRGIAIYIKTEINSAPVTQVRNQYIEVISVKIKLINNDWLLIHGVYRSPSSPNECLIELRNIFNQDRDEFNKFSHRVILGDFNMKEIEWDNETTSVNENHIASRFLEIVRDNFLYQQVSQPTRVRENERESLLDLILTNEENMVEDLQYLPPLGKSDHLVLNFNLILYSPENETKVEKRNYFKGDYEKIRSSLKNKDLSGIINQATSTNEAWESFTDIIQEVSEANIPVCKTLHKKYNTPWMNNIALSAIRAKRKKWNRYQNCKNEENKKQYHEARIKATKDTKTAKVEYERRLAENINSNNKAFWNYVQSKTKTRETIGNLIDEDGNLHTDNLTKCQILNKFFTSVFTQENLDTMPEFPDRHLNQPLGELIINTQIVENYIKKLNGSKSQGPDNCHPKLLLESINEIKEPLAVLFNKSIDEGKVPDQWRLANVIPIHKKGLKSKPENYRPISLTSVASKLLEKIVRDKIMAHMENNNLFTKHQHGFRAGYSCVTQLIDVCDKWTEELDNKNNIDVIYLDFQKAFDSVPHKRLIKKLQGYGIEGNILKWIEDFLSQRKQRVVVGGSQSEWSNVTSGIPQGSVLGPTLFLIYINDLPDVVRCMVKLFADDTKLYAVVNNQQQAEELQTDLINMCKWSEDWQIDFNLGKCKYMHIGRGNEHENYYMIKNDKRTTIKTVQEEKDLGVTVDNKLKFVSHIQNSVKKANRNLGIIKRTFSYLDKTVFLNLFKALVRPHLEYGSTVWSVLYKKDKIAIENVQRRATKLLHSIRNLSYTERLLELGLPSLQYRRIRADMIEVYKIMNGIDKCEKDQLFTIQPYQRTRGHNLKLYKRKFRLDIRKYSFSQRVVNQWNNLPESIVTANSINQFKTRINTYWKDIEIKFQPDCYSYAHAPTDQIYDRRTRMDQRSGSL